MGLVGRCSCYSLLRAAARAQVSNAAASVAHLEGVTAAALVPYPPGPDDGERGSLRQALVGGTAPAVRQPPCSKPTLLCQEDDGRPTLFAMKAVAAVQG
jgi:hypothetical protein